jgi:hypothetical protein
MTDNRLTDDTYCHRGDGMRLTKPMWTNMLTLKLTIFVLILVVFANIAQFSEYMVQQSLASCPDKLVECD